MHSDMNLNSHMKRPAWIAAVLAAALGVMASGAEALALSATFVPNADTRVDEAAPTSNYGTSSGLRTDAGTGSRENTMLRFVLSGVAGPVSKATLRLYATTGTANGPAVQGTSNTWTETAMTWNSRVLPVGTPSFDAGAIASGAWTELDVTKLVLGDGTYSFVLSQTSSDGVDFGSRESTRPPQLVVTWSGTAACASSGDCADANVCTDNACVGGACQSTANQQLCDADGNACTVDACSAGACVAGPTKACSDGDACTGDSCDPATATCLFTPLASCAPAPAPSTGPLVALGAAWRYRDDGIDLGTVWRGLGYADSTWKSGNAELGYGDGDEKTVVAYGPSSTSKFVTTYFRHTFQVADPKALSTLTLRLERDDGAIVYLNGTEVFRSNMPAGTVSATTLASSAIEDGVLYSASPPVALLVAGGNTLAVEVHQASRSSSDISFNLELTGAGGTTSTPPPPPPATSGDPVLVGAGDIAVCGSSKDEATANLLDSIPGTIFAAGDNVYPNGTITEFNTCFEPSWGRHKSRIRPAVGNHEYQTSKAAGYYSYFGAAAGDPTKGYYSYKLGNWLVLVVNSNCTQIGGCGAGSPQEKWVRSELAANPGTCAMAYWHHPRFSSGSHGSQSSMRDIWKALHDSRVELVLSGHDHDYERFAPQSADGVAAADGPVQFVVGTGGVELYTFPGSKPANSVVRNDKTWGVLKLTLHATSADFQFVPVAGQTFTDSGSIGCK